MAPRAARNIKSYAEASQPEKPSKRKKKGFETQEKVPKRGSKVTDFPLHSLPVIEGAAAQVRGWSCGNLSKKDATLFVRAVKNLSPSHFFLLLLNLSSLDMPCCYFDVCSFLFVLLAGTASWKYIFFILWLLKGTLDLHYRTFCKKTGINYYSSESLGKL